MSKLNVSFYLKNDKQRNGESAIYAKIKLGSTTSTMSTGKYLRSVRWEKTNMLQNANRKGNEVSLKTIFMKFLEIFQIYIKLSKEPKNVTARDLKNVYSGKSNNSTDTRNCVILYFLWI